MEDQNREGQVGLPAAVAAILALLISLLMLAGPAAQSGGAAAADREAVSSKAGKRVLGGLFNQRYCEILGVSAPGEQGFPVTVFNTVGLNSCPGETWNSLDFTAIAAERDWLLAAANGPRRWLVDAVAGGKPEPATDLGGLRMRRVATLTATALPPPAFTITKIGRDNNWIFRKGRKVREVIAPNGRRFVMQAYTRTVDSSLNLRALNRTASNPLSALPDGWRFKTRRLKRKLVVKAGGEATIVRDGLGSVYQKYRLPKTKR